MSEQADLRRFFPSGECVPPSGVQGADEAGAPYLAFAELDRGNHSKTLFDIASAACGICRQKLFCVPQAEAIADAMWLEGTDETLIGGVRISTAAEPLNAFDMATTAISFDLSELPVAHDPSEEAAVAVKRLGFLRQGVRANQLKMTSRPPDNEKIISNNYRNLLRERDPDTLEAFDALLDQGEQDKALRYLTLALCQQADFTKFTKGVRSTKKGSDNKRFDPETHNYEVNYATAALYVAEVTDFKRLGFRNPGLMGITHSTDYGKLLIKRFGGVTDASMFHQVVKGQIRRPHEAFAAFSARLQEQRVSGAGETLARRRALTHRAPLTVGESTRAKTSSLTPDEIQDRIDAAIDAYGTDNPVVTPAVIARVAKLPGNPAAKLRDYVRTYNELDDTYGRRSAYGREVGQADDFPPGTLRKLALLPGSSIQANAYTRRLKEWRAWAAEEHAYAVPDSFLREHALSSDAASYDELVKLHKLKLMQERYRAKDTRRSAEQKAGMQTWMMHTVLRLYPVEEVDDVADTLYDMLSRGVITYGVAELEELQDPTMQLSLDDLSDPKTRKYLTFADSLSILRPAQRLMLAHDFNLTRLLYEYPFSAEHIANLGTALKPGYGRNRALTDAMEILAMADTSGHMSLSVIKQDILELLEVNDIPFGRSEKIPLEDIVTYVGGAALALAKTTSEGTRLANSLPSEYREWLVRKVNASYPPSRQARGSHDVDTALRGEQLVVLEDTPSGHYLQLAGYFYNPSLNDVDRAVAAHILGVDRLLYYGRSLDVILQNRLGKRATELAAYMRDEIVPKLEPWESIAGVTTALRSTEHALSYVLSQGASPPKEVWLSDKTLIAVSKGLAADLSDKEYAGNPPPGWLNYRQIAALAAKSRKPLLKALDAIPPNELIRGLYRGDDEVLDVWYAPETGQQLLTRLG